MACCCKWRISAMLPSGLLLKQRPVFMLHVRGGGVGFVAAMWLPVAAMAQPAFILPAPPSSLPFVSSLSGDWTMMVGGAAEGKPDFEGSKRYMASALPIFSIHRAGSPDRFRSPQDNAGIALFAFDGFYAGPVGKFVMARTAASDNTLKGLGDVNAAIEVGGFAEYFPVDWFRTRVE